MTTDEFSEIKEINLSLLNDVPHLKHPFYVSYDTSKNMSDVVLKSFREYIYGFILGEDRIKKRLEVLCEQEGPNYLLNNFFQMQESLSGVSPENCSQTTPAAIIAEEKYLVIEEQKKAQEFELEKKRSKIQEIDVKLAQFETTLNSLNAKKHELFIKFKSLSQNPNLEEVQRNKDVTSLTKNQSHVPTADTCVANIDNLHNSSSSIAIPSLSSTPSVNSKSYNSKSCPSPPSFGSRDSKTNNYCSESLNYTERCSSNRNTHRFHGHYRSSCQHSPELEKRTSHRISGLSPRSKINSRYSRT